MSDFTHLHVHTEYSLLDGLSKIDKLIDRAMEYGMDALAITDHGVMYGAIKFYLACKDAGVKPIIGMESYVAKRSRKDKEAGIDSGRNHLILLAKDLVGYKNLMKLCSLAWLEGFYYKPRIDMDILRQYHEGIIATSACIEGEIPSLLLSGQDEQAEKKAKEFVEIFGGDFYLEIQNHPKISLQAKANKKLIALSRKLGIPIIAANDIHYVDKDDAEAQDALLAVQTQKLISDENRLTMLGSPDFYLKTQEEMAEDFKEVPDAITNTAAIKERCNLEIPIGKWILPNFSLPEGVTSAQFLHDLTYQRIHDRFNDPSEEIVKRVDYELDIINQKGFATYFLIVQDFVNWAKKNKIRVGPGRGSAAGSLVAYALRITSINPLQHNLPFERFLNPERPSPPDIDLDFADDHRDEVIKYITATYGPDHVCQIVTFNVMKAKEAIRDVGRVLGMPYSEPDKIAKLIPLKMNIAESIKAVPELSMFYEQPHYKKLLDLSMKVEGTVRHASTHAAGIVIADKDLNEYVPLQPESRGQGIMSQYDMYSLDVNVSGEGRAVGLLKIDILGLRNLTILEKALLYVKTIRGVEIDLSELPLDDKKAFDLISAGETTGLFQLESAGMRRIAKQLKPNKFSDISAMVALYRPGPMQFVDEFIAGKKNPKIVKYPHPDLKPILEETYGIAVYQEQCMQIANVMGGYSLGDADLLRRAIGKKKRSLMAEEKKKFIKRAVEKGYSKDVSESVFALIERFAGYGFNKAHSTCYAMIAYQTAVLKSHYPVEFMAALLTAEVSANTGPQREKKVVTVVEECRRLKIVVLPPNVNKSISGFTVENHAGSYDDRAIRFGLSAVKNVGEVAINIIIEARELGGEFKSLLDFCTRVDQQKVNKKVLESLIKSGAMDQFGVRAAMISVLDEIRGKSINIQKQASNGQTSLFGESDAKKAVSVNFADNLPNIEEFSKDQLLLMEKELLGFYLTDNPLSGAMVKIGDFRTHQISDLTDLSDTKKQVKVGGLITDLRIVITKKSSQEMAFATIEDDSGSVEIVVFPKTFAKTKDIWTKDKVVLITGKPENRDGNMSLLVDEAYGIDNYLTEDETPRKKDEAISIKIPAKISPQKLMALNKLIKENKGEDKVVLLFCDEGGHCKKMPMSFGINYTSELKKAITEIVG